VTILDKITAYKKEEVRARKSLIPMKHVESFPGMDREVRSLRIHLENSSTGIIAEHKRRSPSKAVINDKVLLTDVVKGYEENGAAGLSILTDTNFFGGSLDDLTLARLQSDLPILRKEFIVDPYQIVEAKAYGADAILLIAACLEEKEIKEFSQFAKSIGLEVLLEIHNEEELKKSLFPSIDLIGVNNRNLKTFEVSIETSKFLADKIPSEFLKISESGLQHHTQIRELKDYGYQGFLMGEAFMKQSNPGEALKQFLSES